MRIFLVLIPLLLLPTAQATITIDAPTTNPNEFYDIARWNAESPVTGSGQNSDPDGIHAVELEICREPGPNDCWDGIGSWGNSPRRLTATIDNPGFNFINFDYPFDLTAHDSANYTFTVYLLDINGFDLESDVITIAFDKNPPIESNLHTPTDGGWTSTNFFQISFDGADAQGESGVSHYDIHFCEGPGCTPQFVISLPAPQNTYSYSPPGGLTEGELYSVMITTVDNAGNSLDSAVHVTQVDTVSPACVMGELPEYVGQTFELTWQITEEWSGVAALLVEASDDGVEWVDVSDFYCDEINVGDESVQCGLFDDGTWYVRCSADDIAGNQGPVSGTEETTVDPFPPAPPIIHNPDRPYINVYPFLVDWEGFDDESGVGCFHVQYIGDGQGGGAAPIANGDTTSTPEDTPVDIDVILNDDDPEGDGPPHHDTLEIVSATVISGGGTVERINANDWLRYTPELDFPHGHSPDDAILQYTLSNGFGTDTAFVTVTVNPVNDPPAGGDDDFLQIPEGTQGYFMDVLQNDNDPEGDTILIDSVSSLNTCGTVTNNGDHLEYDVTGTEGCAETFTYTVCDDRVPEECTTGVSVNVEIIAPINLPPNAIDDVASTPQDTRVDIFVLANDNDPNADPIHVERVIPPGPPNGNAVVSIDDQYISYTPTGGFTGEDVFQYEVCDPEPLCDIAVVTVTVTQANQAPVAQDDGPYIVAPSSSTDLTVLLNDFDPDGPREDLDIESHTNPAHGIVTIVEQGTPPLGRLLNYQAPACCTTVEFDYEVCDQGNPVLCSNPWGTVTVNVETGGACVNCLLGFSGDDEEEFGPVLSFQGGYGENDWTNVTNPVTGYCLTGTEIMFGDGNNNTPLLSDSDNGKTYVFRARVEDNAGNLGTWTPVLTTTTLDIEDPVIDLFQHYDQNGDIPGQGDKVSELHVITDASDAISPIDLHFIVVEVTDEGVTVYPTDCTGNAHCEAHHLPPVFDQAIEVVYYSQVGDLAGNIIESAQYIFSPHPLANFVTHTVNIPLGSAAEVDVQVRNLHSPAPIDILLELPDDEFSPAGFVTGQGDFASFDIDFDGSARTLRVLGLPQNGRGIFKVELVATDPEQYTNFLTLNAFDETGGVVTDTDQLGVGVSFPSAFSGLSDWAMLLLIAGAVLLYASRNRFGTRD